jgi:hypothetical protein
MDNSRQEKENNRTEERFFRQWLILAREAAALDFIFSSCLFVV